MDNCKMADRILNLTLEIIYLLTGKEYAEVQTSSDIVTPDRFAHVSGGWGKGQSSFLKPPPNVLNYGKNNAQKIVKLTNKIIELLTGEVRNVSIRYQDVAVYFAMEEWEYLEEHKDLYKDIMMETQQTLMSLDTSSKQSKPKRSPSRLYFQDCPVEKQFHQVEDLSDIKVIVKEEEDTFVWSEQQCKEENIPTDISPDNYNSLQVSDGHLLTYQDSEAMPNDTIRDNFGERSIIFPSVPPVAYLQTVKQIPGHRGDQAFERYGGNFKNRSNSNLQKKDVRPFSCSECGKCVTRKLDLVKHLRIHTGERPFSCLECNKSFTQKSHLLQHHKIHTGEKPFSCLQCGKCFIQKSNLVKHQSVHTKEKPFLCSECGKYFTSKSNLVKHLRIHTGEKPYSCSECGKSYTKKSNLVDHQKRHKVQNPFDAQTVGNVLPHVWGPNVTAALGSDT
ncbi:zinc finger protein 1-like isoform X2 [Bufo gargarizans]|uniref:zinc finger protein 1-like isoform X2 n=1 Tax=Bufo gargarizans TaxID=30331 RepID=UPI001CF4CD37|nr:zinc finger protein 1-like isoform X2 [Bufo gargarizans]